MWFSFLLLLYSPPPHLLHLVPRILGDPGLTGSSDQGDNYPLSFGSIWKDVFIPEDSSVSNRPWGKSSGLAWKESGSHLYDLIKENDSSVPRNIKLIAKVDKTVTLLQTSPVEQ